MAVSKHPAESLGFHFSVLPGPVAYQDDRENQEVDLRVAERLQDLLGAELAIVDAGHVDRDVLEQRDLLVVAQPAGLHGGVGEEEHGAGADQYGQAAQHDEHDPPAGEGVAGSDMLEAPGHETTEDLADTETQVPEGEAGSLLRLGVPSAADEEQGRANRGLEDTEEHTGRQQGGIAGSGSTASGCDAPEQHVTAEPLGRRNLLQQIRCENSLLESRAEIAMVFFDCVSHSSSYAVG